MEEVSLTKQTNCSLIIVIKSKKRNCYQCSLPNLCFMFSAKNLVVDLSDSTETITMKQKTLTTRFE